MSRNVRTYDHFCVLARALERVGERWSLLVVRDLMTGPKRFTDLMDRLGGITPKTLTQRLRDLEEADIVTADREPGRREVWYRLTEVGRELGPVVDSLTWWGWRHGRRRPDPGERLHAEHLLRAIVMVLDHESPDRGPTRWRLRFGDDGEYAVESDGERWSVRSASGTSGSEESADVEVVAPTTSAWLAYVRDPTAARASDLGLELTGSPAALRRFQKLLRLFLTRN